MPPVVPNVPPLAPSQTSTELSAASPFTVALNTTVSTLGDIINTTISIFIPLAGLILFLLIIYAGFTILTNPNNPDQIERGKNILTNAIIGFLIMFTSFWLAQFLEIIFNVPIVSL